MQSFCLNKTVLHIPAAVLLNVMLELLLPFNQVVSAGVTYCSTPDLPGSILAADDLHLLVYELLDVCAEWYPLGLQLNVKTKTLDRIRRQIPNPRDQLQEMLKVWLITSDKPSWNTLTDALRSRSVGASQLADHLETKYCLVEDMQESKR